MILTDKKPRVNVEGILTAEEIHDIEHHMGHYPYPRAASLDAFVTSLFNIKMFVKIRGIRVRKSTS